MRSYKFSREAAQQIQRTVRKGERVNRAKQRFDHPAYQLKIHIAKSPAGGIAALSGTTPGSASVALYRMKDGDLEAITDDNGNAATITAYNLSSSAVAADTFIQIKQEVATGAMLVDFEDCG
jgi:hypothetical protein